MPNSYVDYGGDGTSTDFTIPFPFLSRSHVVTLVNGIAATVFWLTNGTIRLSAPLAVGSTLRIQRVTPRDKMVRFVDGSGFTGKDVNTVIDQVLFVCQEMVEGAVAGALGVGPDGAWNGEGRRVANVASPINSGDVATKGWSESLTTGPTAAAAALRDQAGVFASTAQQAATESVNAAQEAASNAEAAAASAADVVVSVEAAEAAALDSHNAAVEAAASAAAAAASAASAHDYMIIAQQAAQASGGGAELDPDLIALAGLNGAGIPQRNADGTWQLITITADQDPDLTAIAGLSGAGTLVRNANGTWQLVALNNTLDPDLVALADLSGTGVPQRNADGTWQLVASTPIDPDLTAIGALEGSGVLTRNADGTWALVSTPALDPDLVAIAAMQGSGLLQRNADGTWQLVTPSFTPAADTYPLHTKGPRLGIYYNDLTSVTRPAIPGAGSTVTLTDPKEIAQFFCDSFDGMVLVWLLHAPTSPSYAQTVLVVNEIKRIRPDFVLIGYLHMGETVAPVHTGAELCTHVDQWLALKCDGFFLDECEYGFQTPRAKLNTVVEYIHSKTTYLGRRAFACCNGWSHGEFLAGSSSIYHATLNPTSEPVHFMYGDALFHESLCHHYAYVDGSGMGTNRRIFAQFLRDKEADTLTLRSNFKLHYYVSNLLPTWKDIYNVEHPDYSPSLMQQTWRFCESMAKLFGVDAHCLTWEGFSGGGGAIAPRVLPVFTSDPNFNNWKAFAPRIDSFGIGVPTGDRISRGRFVYECSTSLGNPLWGVIDPDLKTLRHNARASSRVAGVINYGPDAELRLPMTGAVPLTFKARIVITVPAGVTARCGMKLAGGGNPLTAQVRRIFAGNSLVSVATDTSNEFNLTAGTYTIEWEGDAYSITITDNVIFFFGDAVGAGTGFITLSDTSYMQAEYP